MNLSITSSSETPKMLIALVHEPFHNKISKEIEIDGGEGEGRIFSAPAFLPFHLLQGRPQVPAELFRQSGSPASRVRISAARAVRSSGASGFFNFAQACRRQASTRER